MLKAATTVFVMIGIGMLIGWPWLVGERPPETAPRREMAEYAVRLGYFVAALLLVLLVSAIGAWMVMRQQRREYKKEAMENMRELIEGTLQDHERKKQDS